MMKIITAKDVSTNGRFFVFSSTYVFILMFFSVLFSSGVAAQYYKWVDENGRTRYSDKAPIGVEVKGGVEKVGGSKEKKSQQQKDSVETSQTLEPIPYINSIESRRIGLEKILIDLPGQSLDSDVVVGYFHQAKWSDKRISHCGYGQEMQLKFLHLLTKSSSLSSGFSAMFQELGYQSHSDKEVLFANQERQLPELSVAATIVAADIKSCGRIRSVSELAKASTYLEVNWKVFDNLKRTVVFDKTTSGYHDSYKNVAVSRGNLVSFTSAFVNAAKNLLADKNFSRQLNPSWGGQAGGISEEKNNSAIRLDLANSEQPLSRGFSNRINDLKKGTVTVRVPGGHGSGFLISGDYVLTNYHVVQGQSRVLIINDGVEVAGTVIRVDQLRDVALIQIKAVKSFAALSISREPPSTGQEVFVIGTPLYEELDHTVTKGIISAQRIINEQHFYQTDAAINKGNSGGPAFNQFGDVIGVSVAAHFAGGGGSLNLAYLIPIDSALAALAIEWNE